MKRLNSEELELFMNKFEIKCHSILIRKLVQDRYRIIINHVIIFDINKELIKEFI